MVSLLNADATVPSPQTISKDLTHIYNQVSLSVRDRFQEIDTAIHLSVDGWTSPLSASFLGVVASWYQGTTMWSAVLEFIHLTESHTGAYMAEKLVECLTRFRIINQIMTICADNAGNNGTLARCIAPFLPRFSGPASRTNCGAHIVNLLARALLVLCNRPNAKQRRIAATGRVNAQRTGPATRSANASSSAQPAASDDPEVVVDELDRALQSPGDFDEGRELHDSGVVQDAALAAANTMRLDYGVTMSDEEAKEAQDLFPKMSGFTHHLHKSNNDYAAFAKIRERCQDSVASKVEIPSAVNATRWNSELKCAETYRALRTPIEVMTADPAYSKVSKYRLSPQQWELNRMMCDCLAVFREPSLLFQKKNTPVIHEVYPSFAILKFRLELMRDDDEGVLHPAIRIGAQASLNTLDKYMGVMENSEIYSMATVLCPWYKTRWFVEQGYTSSRIDDIVRTIKRRVAETSPSNTTRASHESALPTPAAAALATQPTSPWMRLPTPIAHDAPLNTPATNSVSEYLSSPPLKKESVEEMGGVLSYWDRERERGSPLARLAMDILTAPASSVDAERAFSGGRMAVSYRQHRMSLPTFRAKMALGSWYGTPLLPDFNEVVHILNDHAGTEPEPLDL
ncbi:hypothetical protein FRC12_024762 [Ceratobasidium sp. 428]|nr:hypothetical protein FRC12_024762 [Ceratobasidium sp. 428]